MPFLIQKLDGAARVCFFRHEGKRVTPTKAGVVVDTRPTSQSGDPWLRITEISATEAEAHRKRLAAEEKAAKDAAAERASSDEEARSRRAGLAKNGVLAKTSADLDRSLAQIRAERSAIERGLAANPARKSSAEKRLKTLASTEKKLLEAGAKASAAKEAAGKEADPKPAPAKGKAKASAAKEAEA